MGPSADARASGSRSSGPHSTGPAEAEWAAYFDSLTEAAKALVNEGTDGAPPVFPALSQPTLPLPDSLDGQRDDVTRLLTITARELERRQAEVARELAGLRPRPARSPYRNDAGGEIDVLG